MFGAMSPFSTGPLLVMGGGLMGEALAVGLLSQGWPAGHLAVVEPLESRRNVLARSSTPVAASITEALAMLGCSRAAGPPGGEAEAGGAAPVESSGGRLGAVIAVKPYDVEAVAGELVEAGATRVLSIAAGVTLADLDRWLEPAAVLRAMPNTPALVASAASAVAPGRRAGTDDVEWATHILSAVGTVVELPESLLNAVTGLSGSGPAYVFLMAEALIDAGVLVGLSRTVSRDLTIQTLLGAARLLAETGDEPAALRAGVTSPGGGRRPLGSARSGRRRHRARPRTGPAPLTAGGFDGFRRCPGRSMGVLSGAEKGGASRA
jgi:pyrroline-5-carboxylate reductase